MTVSRRNFLTLSSLAAATLTLSGCGVVARHVSQQALPDTLSSGPASLRTQKATNPIWRLLNRGGYGPRPGDSERAIQMGLENYLEEQLAPDSIDDQAADLLTGKLILYPLPIEQLLTHDRREVMRELLFSTLARPLYSKRQLYEAMVEFWSDHFNIFIGKHRFMPYVKLVDDRDVIRPHALGNFRDLLYASAQSPAMLSYLDNVQNHKAAPNENYARELMELHTLGVYGGYTQQDVQEVARALTGWGVHRRGRQQGHFAFDAGQHDDNQKIVLGHMLPAGQGEQDVHQVLEILLAHHSTARFIATKLVRRFVADEPPASMVERVAQVFTDTNGDIKSMLRAIFLSQEFADAPPKLKRPFTFVVSAMRALHADVGMGGFRAMAEWLRRLGQVPFHWATPDGFPDVADELAGSLLPRWNFALDMTAGRLDGITLRLDELAEAGGVTDTGSALNFFGYLTLGQTLSPEMLTLLGNYVGGDDLLDQRMRDVIGLMLCSPNFQWM